MAIVFVNKWSHYYLGTALLMRYIDNIMTASRSHNKSKGKKISHLLLTSNNKTIENNNDVNTAVNTVSIDNHRCTN